MSEPRDSRCSWRYLFSGHLLGTGTTPNAQRTVLLAAGDADELAPAELDDAEAYKLARELLRAVLDEADWQPIRYALEHDTRLGRLVAYQENRV